MAACRLLHAGAAAVVAVALLSVVVVPGASGSDVFDDVDDDHPFHDEISWLSTTGISTGYPGGRFRPDVGLTRGAFAALAHRFWVHAGGWNLPPTPGAYPDVPAGSAFADDIDWLAGVEVSHGNPDGTFSPGSAVTRQALAAFLTRLALPLGCLPADVPDSAFWDVPPTHPLAAEIALLAHWGITAGFPDGGFHPRATVTRAQVAAFLARLDAILSDPGSDCPRFDFDADGAADFAWLESGTDDSWMKPGLAGNEPLFDVSVDPGEGTVPVPGDYDGTGVDEPAVYDGSDGSWYSASVGVLPIPTPPPLPGTADDASDAAPVPGDYDGDGDTDPAVWDQAAGVWYFSDGGDPVSFGVGSGEAGPLVDEICEEVPRRSECWYDVPVPGDYDGDGTTDLAVWSPDTGELTVFGAAPVGGFDTGFPFVADFNGDGADEFATYDYWTNTWHFLTGDIVGSGAPPGRLVSPADYTGDGQADLVYLDDDHNLVDADGDVVVALPSGPDLDDPFTNIVEVTTPPWLTVNVIRLTYLVELLHDSE